MIKKLRNSDIEISKQIQVVFMASYAIEAKLLDAIDFPPLKRPIEDYVSSANDFYGFFFNNDLAGVVEVVHKTALTHIQSLVVHPDYFRKGIGKALMNFVMNSFDSECFMVETGVKNGPACQLYLSIGFTEIKHWDTSYGIRKIRFKKYCSTKL